MVHKIILNLKQFQNTSLKVGLLGGSFNPAHEGHVYISEKIMKKCHLDYVWWLIAKQNPHKKNYDKSMDYRFNQAKEVAKDKKIIVTDIEKKVKSCYTFNIIKSLKQQFPRIEFYWIMGEDSFLNLNKWHRFKDFINLVNIIVISRDNMIHKTRRCKAFYLAKNVTFIRPRICKVSSTLIREKDEKYRGT